MFTKPVKYTMEEEELPRNESDIHVINNDIYFHEDVSVQSVKELCKQVNILEKKMLNVQNELKLKKAPYIYIYIHSYGGDLFAGLSCMDMLKNCKVPVVTIVDGFVASAATLILLGGHKRWMRRNSNMLIHQIRGGNWGKYDELKDEMTNCDELMKTVKNVYLEESEFPEKKLQRIIKKEIHLNGDACIKYKLVHKLV